MAVSLAPLGAVGGTVDGPTIARAAVLAAVVAALVVVSRTVVRVPGGERRALLAGDEYRRTLGPGLHLVTPFVEREFSLDGHPPLPLPTLEVDGSDGTLALSTVVDWHVTDPEVAFATTSDPRRTIYDAAVELRREHLRELDAAAVRRDLDDVERRLERSLAVEAGRWGVAIDDVSLEVVPDSGDERETNTPT